MPPESETGSKVRCFDQEHSELTCYLAASLGRRKILSVYQCVFSVPRGDIPLLAVSGIQYLGIYALDP